MLKRAVSIMLLILMISACSPSPGPDVVTEAPATATITPAPTTAVPPTETTAPPTPTTAPTATVTPQAYGPDNFPENVNPLTGLAVSDPTILDRRPVAVKVQMFPRGQRPPYGVSLADIVFDFYQNLGATRLTAIFYGQDAERVSPIRSARLFDIEIVSMFDATFAFGSADHRILNRIVNQGFGDRLIIESQTECPPNPMCRVEPNGPNYLITDTALLTEWAAEHGVPKERPDLSGMSFDPEVPEGGQPADTAIVRYNFSNYNRWEYDEATGRYLRFQENADAQDVAAESFAPLMDGLTGEQVAADNVVVLFATHSYAFQTRPGPNEIVEIDLTGTGRAFAFRDGQVYELTWNRTQNDAPLYLTFEEGARYPYKPGNTWYNVIGSSSGVEPLTGEDNGYRFIFAIP
ncbi:MAG: DUF3048 domain-containing protein [Chloroflexi bacterium]|nr:DUF3048 domain-containing protein [Chloroflexota bacterium]